MDLGRIAVTQWARWCLKSSASSLFIQLFIRELIKENIKAPRQWPSCGEWRHLTETFSALLAMGVGHSPVTGEFPAQMASNAENVCIWRRHHVVLTIKTQYVDSIEFSVTIGFHQNTVGRILYTQLQWVWNRISCWTHKIHPIARSWAHYDVIILATL